MLRSGVGWGRWLDELGQSIDWLHCAKLCVLLRGCDVCEVLLDLLHMLCYLLGGKCSGSPDVVRAYKVMRLVGAESWYDIWIGWNLFVARCCTNVVWYRTLIGGDF